MNSASMIIAETAFSHEGNADYLRKQVEAARAAQADYVKFQVFSGRENAYTDDHPLYRSIGLWILSHDIWRELFSFASSLGLKVIVLPSDAEAFDFCLEQDDRIAGYEIHAACLDDVHMLQRLSMVRKNILLGIGGRTAGEIDSVLSYAKPDLSRVILMFGFQSFPTDVSTLDLGKIVALRKRYKDCRIGYADHTSFEDGETFYRLSEYAYLLGVRFFEKHIVLTPGERRLDFESAVSVQAFLALRERLDSLISILGDGDLDHLNSKEQAYHGRRKVPIPARDLAEGEIFRLQDLRYMFSGQSSDLDLSMIIAHQGKPLACSIKKNQVLQRKVLGIDYGN